MRKGNNAFRIARFIRNHFEEFVNKKNVQIGSVNLAASLVDHGADEPPHVV
jgi:hypothetical protein